VRALFDTNVVLDLLLDRQPWSQTAAQLFAQVETGKLEGFLCATTVTTIYYLASKAVGAKQARKETRKLLALCSVAPVNRPVLEAAMELGFTDFEDAVIHEAAGQVAAEAIVTRNPADFKKATLTVLTPDECSKILEQREREVRGTDES
jgi:predicted nucleic acid-binding protein